MNNKEDLNENNKLIHKSKKQQRIRKSNKSKKKYNNKTETQEFNIKKDILYNQSKNKLIKSEKNKSEKLIELSEGEEEDVNNKQNNIMENKISNNFDDLNDNHSYKETNSSDRQNNNSHESNSQSSKKKKKYKLLGKKRHLMKYMQHSLSYNELNKLYDKNEIELNINNLFSYMNLNPKKVKGNFIGLLDNNENEKYPDFIIEINDSNAIKYNHFIIYNSKNFKKKLSFIENSGGNLYLLYRNYAGFFCNGSIKIFYFSNNNTNYHIFQKIILPEELQYAILFPFKFIHNDDYYFFYKRFTLNENERIILYKFNKDEQEDENDHAICGRPFIEDKKIDLDFEFIWFVQKNNNELLFFYELNFIFKLFCFDLSSMSVTQRKTFTLNTISNARIAQYSDDIINNRFLVLSNHNFIYLIDTYTWQITVVKENDIIEYFRVFSDGTLWTVETHEKTVILGNNKRKIIPSMYVRQYKINEKLHEIIKVGERKMVKYYNFINNIVQLGNKKVALFVEGKKLIILN